MTVGDLLTIIWNIPMGAIFRYLTFTSLAGGLLVWIILLCAKRKKGYETKDIS